MGWIWPVGGSVLAPILETQNTLLEKDKHTDFITK